MQRTEVPEHLRQTPVLATDKQVSYLEGLRYGKQLDSLSPEQRAWLQDADFSKIPKNRASDVIGQLKNLPWIPKDKSGMFPAIKDGRYAIPKNASQLAGDEAHSPGSDSQLMFYSVKNGRSVLFVDVWASDTRYPIKDANTKLGIIQAILADPDAGPRFGREIGKCYVCGRTLTDQTSRELGIGPVCRGDQ